MTQARQRDWSGYFASLPVRDGNTLGPTDWVSLSQLEVDLYGGLIADLDPMHNDPDWLPGRERWGGTIIIGTHALSMLPQFLAQHGFPVKVAGVRFEPLALPRVRFVAPLPIDHRIRDVAKVTDVSEESPRSWTVRTEHILEREGLERPFMFAEFVTRFSEV
jgi:acyl dehydratase